MLKRLVRHGKQRGVTLIELMIVLVIISIIGSIGLPMYQNYALRGNLNQAVPYMMEIVAKEQRYFHKYGTYMSFSSEDDVKSYLGIDLSSLGDFCIEVFCRDTTQCKVTWLPGNSMWGQDYTTGDSNVHTIFFVLAVLRGSGSSNPQNGSYVCTSATNKAAPSGWVGALGSGAGSETRLMILAYPPPADNTTAAQDIGDHKSVALSWVNGLTLSDAVTP